MEMYLRALNSLLRSIPPWGIALLAMAAFFMILFGIIKIVSAFRRKLTPEEQKKREIELDEAETVSKLTQNDNRNAFDRWFAQMLEEGNTKLSPFTASLFILATLILTGGLVLVLSDNVPLALGTGIICMVLPMVYWLLRRSWRLGQMRKHLPETLEAIGDAIRGGLSLEEAIQMTSEQIEDPLKTEFQYANRQLQMGQSPSLVMERMAHRIPITEFRLFTTAVMVHRTTGGNLAQLAERLARSSRDRQEFHGHLNAISAGSRMSIIGLVIVTALAVMILSGLDYTYVYRFIMNPYGPVLLGITLGLFVIGGFWAWSIMRVKY